MTESKSPGARDLLQGLFPGLFVGKVLVLSIGAALLGLVLVGLALGLVLTLKGKAMLVVGGLLVWGHGAAWLVNGELQSITSALADFAGAKWGVFLGLWWGPIAILWGVFGALTS